MSAPIEIGRIAALFRYPVKSMRGESLAAAMLGWYGITGDRRVALRKVGDRGAGPGSRRAGFPSSSASSRSSTRTGFRRT